ncbi:thiamine biosynthesis lipoprotein [Yoonia maritima]|uniref:FAD:protein FMN transferase n=1 Tax=Yoonia maritima TaxID=1435347 RepID=A0A2T0VXB4_9RHOB|nr:FAD:protein FMN transferase [Yoonia maritima]PRY76599.1 thiamine biosynthesis lipoprotein [Yoonia maritima]
MSQSVKLSRRSFMLVPLCLAACKPGESLLKVSGLTMGTTYNVAIADAPRFVSQSDVKTAVDGALATVNQQMSNWDANSEISRFNAQTSTDAQVISAELAEVMTAAETVHLASGGRFDTTLGPVIELWGFGADDHSLSTPNEASLLAAQAKSGHANTLRVTPGALQKTQPDANIYLAAIGKGYGADLVGRALEQLGVHNYLIEIGGDLYASGHNADGTAWQIGIETPEAHGRGVLDVVSVSNVGLASSGDYRNFFEQDGQRYSHLIDPRTGRPVTHNTASTTVLAENAMLADAWATAFHIIGQEEGLVLAEELDLAVLFTQHNANANAHGFTTTASSRFTALTQV